MATKTYVEHYCDGCGKKYDPSSVQNYPMDFNLSVSWKRWDGSEPVPISFRHVTELCPECGLKVIAALEGIGVIER